MPDLSAIAARLGARRRVARRCVSSSAASMPSPGSTRRRGRSPRPPIADPAGVARHLADGATRRSGCASSRPRPLPAYVSGGIAAGVAAGKRFLEGWAAFDRLAPRAARDLVTNLEADPTPLVAALGRLPRTGLHGDLKLSNLAPLEDGRVALIDWQMTMLAPVAVELGWLLVGNSGVLRDPPEVVLERYRAAARSRRGRGRDRHAAVRSGARLSARGGRGRDRRPGDGPLPAARRASSATGMRRSTWPRSSGCCCAAGERASTPRRARRSAPGSPAREDLAWWCDRAVEAAARRL